MIDVKKLIDSGVDLFTKESTFLISIRFDIEMSKVHPAGISHYFKELIYFYYNEMKKNSIGRSWIFYSSIDPFSKSYSSNTWIENQVQDWLNDYTRKYNKTTELEIETAVKSEIQTFLFNFYHIQKINNYLASLNNPRLATNFSDFLNPEFRNKDLFITRLKEKMHGKKSQALRFMVEVLKAREILNVNYGERKQLFEAMKDYFDWNIGTYVSIFDIPALREFKTSDDFQLYISSQNCQHKRPYQKIEIIIDSILKELHNIN